MGNILSCPAGPNGASSAAAAAADAQVNTGTSGGGRIDGGAAGAVVGQKGDDPSPLITVQLVSYQSQLGQNSYESYPVKLLHAPIRVEQTSTENNNVMGSCHAQTLPSQMYVDETGSRQPNVMLGVSVSSLEVFITQWGGRDRLRGLSAATVGAWRQGKKFSLAEQSQQHVSEGSPVAVTAKPASWYISLAPECMFLDAVDAIQHFFEDSGLSQSSVIWWDLFSLPQTRDDTFESRSSMSLDIISKTGRVIQIIQLWANPIAYKSAWTVYDLYVSIVSKAEYHIAMAKVDEDAFLTSLLNDSNTLYKVMSAIKIDPIISADPTHSVRVHQAVASSVGFAKLDQCIFRSLTRWIESTIKRLSAHHSSDVETKCKWIEALAKLYNDLGQETFAEPLLKDCLEQRKQLLGVSHVATLRTMHNLASVLWALKKEEEAETLLKDALEHRRRTLGEDHPDTIKSLAHASHIQQRQGNLDQAQSIISDCINSSRRISGENHTDTISYNYLLGLIHMDQKLNYSAEVCFKDCLERTRVLFGNNYPGALPIMDSLALLYNKTGKHKQAEELFRQCVDGNVRFFGEDHHNSILYKSRLAISIEMQDRKAEAEILYLEVIEQSKRVLGNDHRSTLFYENYLADMYRQQGMNYKAAPLMRTCVEKSRRIFGPDHVDTLEFVATLAVIYHNMKQYEDAELLYKDCLDRRRKVLGHNQPDTTSCMDYLAVCFSDQGKDALAEPLYSESFNHKRRTLGPQHPDTVSTLRLLNQCKERMGKSLNDTTSVANTTAQEKPSAAQPDKLLIDSNTEIEMQPADNSQPSTARINVNTDKQKEDAGPGAMHNPQFQTHFSTGDKQPLPNGSLEFKSSAIETPAAQQTEPDQAQKTKEDTGFSLLGVPVSFLDEFIADCGGRDQLNGLTTTDICEKFVKPKTLQTGLSLCKQLTQEGSPVAVSDASWFISHAWKFKFLDVVGAIQLFLQNEGLPDSTIIWFDLFSNSQHGTADRPFEWWTGTFMNAIKTMGNVVMILSPWNDPIPLTRAWCVFELYSSAETKSNFHVAMTQSEQDDFLTALQEDPTKFTKLLGTINSERSESFLPGDRTRIHDAIRRTIGFVDMDRLLFKILIAWIEGRLKALIERSDADDKEVTKLDWMESLANLYMDLKQYDQAEPLYYDCLKQRKSVLGDNHTDTLRSMEKLANLYHAKGGYFSNDEELVLECFRRRAEVLGLEHPDTVRTMVNAMVTADNNGTFEQTKYLYEVLLQKCENLFGPNHPETIRLVGFMGESYIAYERYGKNAEELLSLYVERSKNILGNDHPSTGIAISKLAQLFIIQEKYEEAEKLLSSFIDQSRRQFGKENSNTILANVRMGELYTIEQKFDLAEPIFNNALAQAKKTVGEDHADTIACLSALASWYEAQEIYERAEALFEECRQRCSKVWTYHHPSTVFSSIKVANVHLKRGKIDDAMDAMLWAETMGKSFLKETHPALVHAKMTFLRCMAAKKWFDQAKSMLPPFVALLLKTFGAGHKNTRTAAKLLFDVYTEIGQIKDAQFVSKRFRLELVPPPPYDHDFHESFAVARFMISEVEKADPLIAMSVFETLLQSTREARGETDRLTLALSSDLAKLQIKAQKFDDAEPLCKLCVENEQAFNEDPVEAIMLTVLLAEVYENQGKQEEALELYKGSLQRVSSEVGICQEILVPAVRLIQLTERLKKDAEAEFACKILVETICSVGLKFDIMVFVNHLSSIYSKQGRNDDILPLLEMSLEHIRKVNGDTHDDIYGIIDRIIPFYWEKERFAEAEPLCKLQLQWLKGKNEPQATVQVMTNLSLFYSKQGKSEDALSQYKDVVQELVKHLGEDHEDTRAAKLQAAKMCVEIQNWDEAVSLYQQIVEQTQRLLGDGHTETLDAKIGLGYALEKEKKFTEAADLYKEILPRLREIDANTYISISTRFASLYQHLERLDEAEVRFKEVLEQSRLLLGDDNLQTLTILDLLWRVCYQQDKFDVAFPIMNEFIDRGSRVAGENNADVLDALNFYCSALFVQGKYQHAVKAYTDFHRRKIHLLREDDPDTIATKYVIGALSQSLGKFQESLVILQDCLEHRRKALGADHCETFSTEQSMGLVLVEQGDFASAESILIESRARAIVLVEPNSEIVTDIDYALGFLYLRKGEYERARELFMKIIQHYSDLGNEESSTNVSTKSLLGLTFIKLGKYDQAEELLQAALEYYVEKSGKDHPDSAECMHSIALLRTQQGRYAEAEDTFKSCIEVWTQACGNNGPKKFECMHSLAKAYLAQCKNSEAKVLLEECLEGRARIFGSDNLYTIQVKDDLATINNNTAEGNP